MNPRHAIENDRQGFRISPATRANRLGFAALLGLVALLATFPWWADSARMREFDEIACYLVFASMWNLLAGFGGMVSIGQQAYFGLGGYALVALSDFAGVNPFVAVPLAAALSGIAALPLSRFAFRLQGGYFAIGTWVLAEVIRISVANVSAVGGGSGTSLVALRGIDKAVRESTTFWSCLAASVAVVGGAYWLLRSRQGLALLAIRDSEVAAASQGIDVQRTKLLVYVVAGAGAGLAGALYFLGNLRISPDAAFSVNWTAFSIFIVLIGGLGTIEGPIVGTLIFWLSNRFLSDYGTWYLVGLGALAIAITLGFPRGLWGYSAGRYGVQIFPVGRRLITNEGGEHGKHD
jgi:branched-chain amino acid transport system permease protein